MLSLKAIRRNNLRLLAEQVGGIGRLAECLEKHQSQMTHIIGKNPVKNMGDRLAAQVETVFQKPPGWLDREQGIEIQGTYREKSPYGVEEKNILCAQVPLINWDKVTSWHEMKMTELEKAKACLIPVTMKVSSWAFALKVRDESMESSGELSIPEGAVIVVEPDAVARHESLVVVTLNPRRGATLKQLLIKGGERYLKPLNARYPILNYTVESEIHGVVKQMRVDFGPLNPENDQNTERTR